MDNDRFEILMGRFIDGEIEPSEQHLLEAQLAADPQSRRLFDQFRQLHTMAQTQITPLANTGRSFDSIFAAAWQQSRRNHRRIAMPWGLARFVSGVAAGVLIAVLVQTAMRPSDATPPATAALPRTETPDRVSARPADANAPIIQNVDYYEYTDADGRRWLIEGVRENIKSRRVTYQDI